MTKRILAAALSWLLILLPMSALAGAEYVDLLEQYQIRPCLKGTVWQDEEADSVYYAELPEGKFAAAILTGGRQRSLVIFQNSGKGWTILEDLPHAVCQGQYCHMFTGGGKDFGVDENVLVLTHFSSRYSTEYFYFRLTGGQWRFEEARLYSYTGETEDEDFYEQPKQVARYTLENGKLKQEFYLEDLYGKLEEEKLAQPGDGYWVRDDSLATQWLEWKNAETLDRFDVKNFPRDDNSLFWIRGTGNECEYELGEPDPNLEYAVVNNPNPKDRLNLREAPDKNADYMGKYYNGTLVRVIHRQEDGWVRVFLLGNNCVGYMREEYLAFGEDMDSVENACPVFTAPEKEWELLYAPFDESNVKRTFGGGESFQVLGFVEDWWHIQVSGDTDLRGYIREYVSLQ